MITVNIDLKDKEFGRRLGRALSSCFVVNISETDDAGDIIITDYNAQKECKEGTIYLTDTIENCKNNIVYRFEKAENICKKVIYEYCRYYDDYISMATGSPCNITGVCSSRGGTGCSSIAAAIAQEMQRTGKQKVIYISLDMIPISPEDSKCEMNINRLLFNFFTKGFRKEDLTACLSLDEYKVSYLNYARPYNKLLQIKGSEFIKFISNIAESGLFTQIVLDLGSGIGEVYDKAFAVCSKIIKVTDENADVCNKDKVYDAHIRELAGGDIVNVINKFTVPDEKIIDEIDAVYVDYDPGSIIVKEDMIHICPEKEINGKISNITEKIMAK